MKAKKTKKPAIEEDGEDSLSSYPDEEQGIVPEKHGEDEADEMESGEKDEDIYDETGREIQREDDDISSEEEGFVEGYQKSAKRKKSKR